MVDVTPLGDGRFLIADGSRNRVAYGVASGRATWVFLQGRTFVVEETPRNRDRGTGNDEWSLAAPMPSTVARLHVQVGQQVARGDVLIVLEAMKMELPLKAPRDGQVKAIACREGDLVQPGVPLLELA